MLLDCSIRLASYAGFANEGQLLLVNAASLTELHCRLPPQQATQQPAAAASAQQLSSAASHESSSQGAPGGGVVTASAAAAIESDFSEASAVLQPPQQAAVVAPAMVHPAAGSPAHVARFRPNLLIEGPAAFAEDGWRSVQIGGLPFNVTGVQHLRRPAADSADCWGAMHADWKCCWKLWRLLCKCTGRPWYRNDVLLVTRVAMICCHGSTIILMRRPLRAVRDGVRGPRDGGAVGAGAAAHAGGLPAGTRRHQLWRPAGRRRRRSTRRGGR